MIKEKFVKKVMIEWLSRKGWGSNLKAGETKDKGVDIKVKHNRYSRYFLIETKGEGNIKESNEVNFIMSLGQIITRMTVKGKTRYNYGLGLPANAAKKALRRLPWNVAKKLSLYIFSVDSHGKVTQYSWKELKASQENKVKLNSKGKNILLGNTKRK